MNNLSTPTYWLISVILSVLAIALIGFQWSQAKRAYGQGMHVIEDQEALRDLLGEAETVEFKARESLYEIPTGFFIQSMAFVSPSDVNVTGYVWQKYPEAFPAGFVKGFVFPEEVDSSNTTIEERYRAQVEHAGQPHELIGWYFDVTLRQSFDYSAYPLDFLTIWLRLWPKDFEHDDHILFLPDTQGYADTGQKTFGLDREIVQGEWHIDETFFSFNDISYDTDFGYEENPGVVTYKEFFFNVGVKRKFINAFVINLVPLFLVALLLFGALMTVTRDAEQSKRFGSNTSFILATCSALFFVVLLAHVQVRRQFAGSGMVYIEYFYLVMYVALLFTAVNAYLFSLKWLDGRNLLHFRDNLLAKILYWPLLLWAIAAITWMRF